MQHHNLPKGTWPASSGVRPEPAPEVSTLSLCHRPSHQNAQSVSQNKLTSDVCMFMRATFYSLLPVLILFLLLCKEIFFHIFVKKKKSVINFQHVS